MLKINTKPFFVKGTVIKKMIPLRSYSLESGFTDKFLIKNLKKKFL